MIVGGAPPATPRRPRTGARRALLAAIAAIPDYLRLFAGLFTDRRVAWFDKLLVIGAIVYAISPLDLIPDFIPVIGQADDVFLLLLATRRLISNAGRRVVMSHWPGHPDALSGEHLELTMAAVSFFLPRRIVRRLVRRSRR